METPYAGFLGCQVWLLIAAGMPAFGLARIERPVLVHNTVFEARRTFAVLVNHVFVLGFLHF